MVTFFLKVGDASRLFIQIAETVSRDAWEYAKQQAKNTGSCDIMDGETGAKLVVCYKYGVGYQYYLSGYSSDGTDAFRSLEKCLSKRYWNECILGDLKERKRVRHLISNWDIKQELCC